MKQLKEQIEKTENCVKPYKMYDKLLIENQLVIMKALQEILSNIQPKTLNGVG